MIGYLSGKVLDNTGEQVLMLIGDIGYEVNFSGLADVDTNLELFVSAIYREDSRQLFGFKSSKEKHTFEALLKVKGVGPRSAYSLVGSLGVTELWNAILLEDKNIIKKAPGIGVKAAAQIILDLKDKSEKFMLETAPKGLSLEATASGSDRTLLTNTLMACKELGFRESEILPLLKDLVSAGGHTEETLMKSVLKEL